MQSGGGSHGRNPAAPPSSSSSPSSSAVSNQLGFESIHQHQQQQQLNLLNQQQQLQQQQHLLKKPEGEENPTPYKAGGVHNVIAGSNFPVCSGSIPASHSLRKYNDSPHQHGTQFHEDSQNKGRGPEQHTQNPVHQAYLQFALQAAQLKNSHGNMLMQHQAKFGVIGQHGRDQDVHGNNLKMQDLMSLQTASQPHGSMFPKPAEQFGHGEKQMEQGRASTYQRNDLKPQNMVGQQAPTNMTRPMQLVQSQSMENAATNHLLMAQFQAWAMERNIDLSIPTNAALAAQLLPIWQSDRLSAMQKPNESGTTAHQPGLSLSKQQNTPSSVGGEPSIPTSYSNDLSGQAGQVKSRRQTPPSGSISSGGMTTPVRTNSIPMQQQLAVHNKDIQIERVDRPSMLMGNVGSMMHPPQSSCMLSHIIDHSGTKNRSYGTEPLQTQHFRQLQQSNCPPSQPAAVPVEASGTQPPTHEGLTEGPQQRIGFTKQQLHVLKAQILAFRRLKRGEGALPQEVLQAIVPSPLNLEPQLSAGISNNENFDGKVIEEQAKHAKSNNTHQLAPNGHGLLKEESVGGEEKAPVDVNHLQGPSSLTNEPLPVSSSGKVEQNTTISVKTEQEAERDGQLKSVKSDHNTNKGKSVPLSTATVDSGQIHITASNNSAPPPKDVPTRKYHGPLFDFPCFARKPEAFGLSTNSSSGLTLAYDLKDMLYEEGIELLYKKRAENLKKISGVLAINLERKRISPDLVLRLQIEEKKLRLLDFQAHLRHEVDQHQQEIMAMPDRPYRKFVRQCERQRIELSRQAQQLLKATREKQLKYIFQWRKKLLEAHWVIRDARTTRNRGVAKYHERMLREFSKRKDGDRNKRMEALKNNDVDRYREMLLEQQTNVPGDASQRYAVLSSFLSQTEEYLHKLGGKITAAKNNQEVEEAAKYAAAAARAQGLSEEEVKAAAICAGEEVLIRNRFSEMNAPKDSTSDNKYYNMAHAVNERVVRQPSMLRMGTLRDYQLVGLQWMLSLYNNKLNGILADEMGLGKTVQVMALIAYLMEFKGNYGPHLIIVPNAVLVNWKSELHNWLPSVSCIFYVGAKEQRAKLFSHNDLKELWSLLNLLLPEVFDNKKAFHDWFSKPFQKDVPSHSEEEDDWLETEKKVIIIHRLHQILEPFMLRRRVEDVEGSLPRKVSIVLRCRMSAIQGATYDWIKSTGTIRVDPEDESRRAQKNPMYQVKIYKNLNNKCMELRKACNHPLLNYPYFNDYSKEFLVRSCGKLWILDRILIKLQRAGHRVLLFSTMTKLLDILEEYLQWRRLVYRRIDGTTSLDDRESAIVDFNSTDSDCFIFLLSIRAAGRGLNLQTADTVVIYDPDPNPQNEEQAVARAHRIGQKREVKVIYMEAVVDKFSSFQKEDESRTGCTEELEDDLAGKDRYIGSIESLIRSNIQQYKMDMADEVINAGRFDQRTTHEERRMTLETLLHDEERYQETVHDVPSLQEVNRMIARSEEEIELFDQMDEDFDWTEEMIKHNQIPNWMRASSRELDAVVAKLSKKPSKNILASSMDLETSNVFPSPSKTERRGRSKSNQKNFIYREVDDDDLEDSDASSAERNTCSLQEEDGEIGEFEDEDFNGDVDLQPNNKDHLEGDLVYDSRGYAFAHTVEGNKNTSRFEEAAASGSSSGTRRLNQSATPSSLSSQKFVSLSALDANPNRHSKKMTDELEEGEIAASGDSYLDHQQSGSWNQDRDDGDDEQVLQPKIKRKRSSRIRPKCVVERLEDKACNERGSSHVSQLAMHADHAYNMQSRIEPELGAFGAPGLDRHDASASSLSQRCNLPPRMISHVNMQNSSRLSYLPTEAAMDHSRESWNGKAISTGGTGAASMKMSDSMQRKCKNVISKLQRRISKNGYQNLPVLYELWKRNESSSLISPSTSAVNPLDLRRIDQCVDNLEYSGVTEFISDMQLMLKNVVQYCKHSYEVKYEARKFHDLLFDVMKIAFPDTDFREARNALAFPSHGGDAAASSPKLAAASAAAGTSQSKRQRTSSEAEPNPGPAKPNIRGGSVPPDEGRMTRANSFKFQKGPRHETGTFGPDQVPPAPSLTHPGDLLICKKKRQDRRVGPVSPTSQGRPVPGPLSPPNTGRLGPASPSSMGRGVRGAPQQKEATQPAQPAMRWAHQPRQQRQKQQSSGVLSRGVEGDVQWAKPVKRMRTDAGKRRPSHL